MNTLGNVIGIGTDIIECERIGRMIEKHGDVFLNRVFTEEEQTYCSGRKAANQHFAGRWAAKEAVLKALGTGWAKGIEWTDVGVVNQQGGRPLVILTGMAKEISLEQGIREVLLSISHTKEYATAYVTALS